MDALIATSRAVNQNPIYKRQQQKKLQFHTLKIQNITSQRFHLKQNGIKIDFTQNLRKAKSAAKLFKMQQDKQMLKKHNHYLLQKLVNVQPTFNIKLKDNPKSQRKISTTSLNWMSKIKQQNDKIQKQTHKKVQLINQINVKDMKKKIQQEIKEYLQLKNQIRKIKYKKNTKSEINQTQRCKSQKKIKPLLQLSKQNKQNKQKKEQKVQINQQNQEQN